MAFFKKFNKVESAGEVYITTIPALRKAVKKASIVLAVPVFGSMDQEVKIAKQDMLEFLKDIDDDESPDGEGYNGSFGFMRGTTLHIG